jgi:hypothetical protein
MARGGKRPNAGRKKGPEGEAYRQALLQLIEQNKEGLAKALVDKGLAGDITALKEINDRAMGKAPQPLTGNNGKDLFPIPILANTNVSTDNGNPQDSPASEAD